MTLAAHHIDFTRQQLVVPLLVAVNSAMSANFVVPGPPAIIFWGVAVPSLSLLFGVVGVLLGQLLAPAPAVPLGWKRRSALVASLLGIAIGIVIATGQQPLVAMAWGIGLGFSGLSVAQALGTGAMDGIKSAIDAFTAMVAARIGAGKGKDQS